MDSARRARVHALHELHFVKKRGNEAVREVVESRAQEAKKADARAAKVHRGWLNGLHAAADEKVKNGLAHGSMSIWTKEERDQIEERRQDPDEARERMTGHMRELAQTHKNNTTAMMERVHAVPSMNVRSKEDHARIEELRRDPGEARDAMKTRMEAGEQSWKREKASMMEKVKAMPSMSSKPKTDAARSVDEAKEKMAREIRELARSSNEERNAMQARLENRPAMSLRTREQQAEIEERRQDPDEAAAAAAKRLRALAEAEKVRSAGRDARVRAMPKLNIRSKSDRERMEEARQDPDEARETMTQYSKELSRSYRDQRNAMTERVRAIPAMTFRHPEQRAVMDAARSGPLSARTRGQP